MSCIWFTNSLARNPKKWSSKAQQNWKITNFRNCWFALIQCKNQCWDEITMAFVSFNVALLIWILFIEWSCSSDLMTVYHSKCCMFLFRWCWRTLLHVLKHRDVTSLFITCYLIGLAEPNNPICRRQSKHGRSNGLHDSGLSVGSNSRSLPLSADFRGTFSLAMDKYTKLRYYPSPLHNLAKVKHYKMRCCSRQGKLYIFIPKVLFC